MPYSTISGLSGRIQFSGQAHGKLDQTPELARDAIASYHVVENDGTLEVRTSDSESYTAKIVARDPLSDLALIEVEGRNDFSCVRLAD